MTTTIALLGDSLSDRYIYLTEQQSLIGRLEAELNARGHSVDITDHAVPGYNTHDARFFSLPGLIASRPDAAIVALGTNDARFFSETGNTTNLDQTEANLRSILTQLRDNNIDALLVGTRTDYPDGRGYSGAQATAFEAIYTRLANEFGVPLVEDIYGGLTLNSTTTFDNLHPNANGVNIMVNGIINQVESFVRTVTTDTSTTETPPADNTVAPPPSSDSNTESGGWEANIYTFTGGNLVIANDLGNRDRLVFNNLRSDQVSFSRNGDDLVATTASGTVTVSNHFVTANSTSWVGTRIEDFVFTDRWVDWQNISIGSATGSTTPAPEPTPEPVVPDTTTSSPASSGNVTALSGGWEGDIYTFSGNNLHITNDLGNRDRLVMESLRSDQVSYFREGNDLVVEANTGGSVRISDHFETANSSSWVGTRIEDFVFTNGWVDWNSISATARGDTSGSTTTTAPEPVATAPAPSAPATDSSSSLPTPTQTLSGGWESNVYTFAGGDIAISDIGNRDRIEFGSRSLSDANFQRSGSALVIQLDDGSVTIDGHFNHPSPNDWAGNRVEDFVFSSGSHWVSYDTLIVPEVT